MAASVNPEAVINNTIISMSSSYSTLHDRLWAKALSQFPVVPLPRDDACPTMCTDGIRIYYNPKFVVWLCTEVLSKGGDAGMVKSAVRFVLAHELMHIIDKHVSKNSSELVFKIPEPKDKAYKVLRKIENMATDAVINAKLKKEFDKNTPDIPMCIYEGEETVSWTDLFVRACNEMSVSLARKFLNKEITKLPKSYYESIDLFRKIFNKLPKEAQDQIADKNEEQDQDQEQKQGQGSQGKKKKSGQNSREDTKEGGKDASETVSGVLKKVFGGDRTLDDHDKSEEMSAGVKEHITESKIGRVMNAVKNEYERSKNSDRTAGTVSASSSLLVSLCEKYFRPKPEPWYVGISMLMKSKIQEGRQVRERIPPLEMLSQVMGGSSVVQFERQGRRLNLAFALDVSGSMDEEEVLTGALKILEFVERQIPPGSQGHRFVFCQIDADIQEWKEMTIPSVEYMEWKNTLRDKGLVRKGYGGTVFAPFFKKLNDELIKPDAVVVFSDMGLYDFDQIAKEVELYKQNIVWLCCSPEIPDEFYKYDLGRIYETQSLFEEIRQEQEMER